MITENNTAIGVPEDKDFYFPDAMADKAIEWLHGVRAQDEQKPFFMYFSTGCAHAPHHVPKHWADKYAGRFDEGWDRYREATFERQKKLGVVPEDTELTPRNDAMPAWDSLTDGQKKLYARQMEVYAGFQENADHNVGRVLDALEEMGELDDTLVIYIWGDNGASMEGTLTGGFNELSVHNGIPLDRGAAARADRALRRPRRMGRAADRAALFRLLGLGRQRPVPVGQADGLATSAGPATRWWSRGRGGSRTRAGCASSSPIASTSPRRSSRSRGSRSPCAWTGSSRSRSRAPASPTRSPTPGPRSATRGSTSRASATTGCTRTAGGRAASRSGSRGTSRTRR